MTESLRTRVERLGFNFFPAFRRTGARITYVREDWRGVHIRLPLNRGTRNYVGTIFGGAMYAAVDPILMVMWLKLLPHGSVVWVKHGEIDFLKPGRETLYARFVIDDREWRTVDGALRQEQRFERGYEVPLAGADGEPRALVRQVLHFRRGRS